MLRPNSRPRASADLGYRLLAGVVAGGFAELLGVNVARDRNPDCPDYLTTSLVAVAIAVAVAVIDPPDDGGRVGDAWLAPDGTLTPAPYGHAEAAVTIAGVGPDYEPNEDELRCCGAEFDEVFDEDGNEIEDEEEAERVWRANLPWGCLAEARLTNTLGYQRVQGRYTDLGFELFTDPTTRQVNTLKRLTGGANISRPLYLEIGDTCSEEGHGRQIQAPADLVSFRHRAVDEAVRAVQSGDEGF